nr:MAG TPA: hypothetical protein [Bacteriophage sp.]
MKNYDKFQIIKIENYGVKTIYQIKKSYGDTLVEIHKNNKFQQVECNILLDSIEQIAEI